MTRLIAISLILAVSILSGCATAYVPEGMNHCAVFGMCRGGYSENQLDQKTFSVSFQGNGRTPRETTQKYLVYRCAELTVNSGHQYFVFLNEHTEVVKNKYRANAVIQLVSASEAVNNSKALNAKDILKNLEPEIQR